MADGAEVDRLVAGQRGFVLLNQTPFYGESGGQVGDVGIMSSPGVRLQVSDTLKKLGDLFVHDVIVEEGEVALGLPLDLVIDHDRRSAIRANHSATHLLHEALRQVLGPHVAQKGSLVDPDRLRFDVSHPKPISEAELARVEDIANAVVLQNEAVATRLMGIDEARASGARALFGEKYGDEVRVVSMGRSPTGEAPGPYSIELCGGTHAARTGDIGIISVVGESAVASGVRRIEARTGMAARRHLNGEAARLKAVAQLLKATPDTAAERLQALVEERRRLDREVSDARRRLAMGGGGASPGTAPDIREIGGVRFFARSVTGIDMKDLIGLADVAKTAAGSGVVAIVGVGGDGKAGIVVAVTPDLTGRFNAVDLVRAGSAKLGGKGEDVEAEVNREVLRQTMNDLRKRNADLNEDEVAGLIDEELGATRAAFWTDARR